MEKKLFLKSSSVDEKKTLATASVRINNPKQGLFRNLINDNNYDDIIKEHNSDPILIMYF